MLVGEHDRGQVVPVGGEALLWARVTTHCSQRRCLRRAPQAEATGADQRQERHPPVQPGGCGTASHDATEGEPDEAEPLRRRDQLLDRLGDRGDEDVEVGEVHDCARREPAR